MSLYHTWRETGFEHGDQEAEASFWKEFSSMEKHIYETLLDKPNEAVEGQLKELAVDFGTSDVTFMGFLDGINDSLKNPLSLEELTEDSVIRLEIDLEKLYYNMWAANADYLYTLHQWDNILTPERRKEIEKEQKRSKIVVKEDKIGRNDPCTCGSGKKYKKCCGK